MSDGTYTSRRVWDGGTQYRVTVKLHWKRVVHQPCYPSPLLEYDETVNALVWKSSNIELRFRACYALSVDTLHPWPPYYLPFR